MKLIRAMSDHDRSRLQGLVIGAGGDAFIILTAIFAVLLVTVNFQASSPENPSEPSKEELKQKIEELKQKVKETSQEAGQLKSKLRRAKSRVKDLSIKLSGPSSPAAPENTPIYVYLRQQGGDLVVEKGEQARSVRQGKLGGALRELGGRSVVLLAEPGVPSGTVTQIVDRVKGALPEASTSLGTLKK